MARANFYSESAIYTKFINQICNNNANHIRTCMRALYCIGIYAIESRKSQKQYSHERVCLLSALLLLLQDTVPLYSYFLHTHTQNNSHLGFVSALSKEQCRKKLQVPQSTAYLSNYSSVAGHKLYMYNDRALAFSRAALTLLHTALHTTMQECNSHTCQSRALTRIILYSVHFHPQNWREYSKSAVISNRKATLSKVLNRSNGEK